MLKRIEIQNLFGEYSYVIDWDQTSYPNLLYITAPNGMGKTTILRMVAGLSTFAPEEYAKIPFGSLELVFDGGERIVITRKEQDIEQDVMTDEIPSKEVILTCDYIVEKNMISIKEQKAWLYSIDAKTDQWRLQKTTEGDLLNMMMLLESDRCRFFQDDRIFHALDGEYERKCIDPQTIKGFLKDLQMGLDSAFVFKPEGIDINEWNEVEVRKAKVLKVLDFLKESDIYIGGYDQYKKMQELGGADLILQLKRMENAIRENRDEVRRLNAYRRAVKRFGFVGKELHLSPRYGYRMVPKSSEKPLRFKELASGEKHLLCLLNGLFFVQTESPLVLIDEPEMSYHMYWQMQFCKTIKEVVKLMGLRVLVATHSPQMFDGDFSLTTDLYSQYKRQ